MLQVVQPADITGIDHFIFYAKLEIHFTFKSMQLTVLWVYEIRPQLFLILCDHKKDPTAVLCS